MRRIDYIVVHSSASPEGREDTIEDIDRWHRARGMRGVGYHYVIELDGVVFEGRPLSMQGAHVRGWNAHSIGICYIGGTDNTRQRNAKDTRTPEQKRSLEYLLTDLKTMFPDAEIVGHGNLAATACPSFDAREEYKHIEPRF